VDKKSSRVVQLWNWIKALFNRRWNPLRWHGNKWMFRGKIYFEVDRNKLGRVTLCPYHAWIGSQGVCRDAQLSELTAC